MIHIECGEELVFTAGAIAAALCACMTDAELAEFCELLGLVKHDMDIIRYRRAVNKKC